MKLRIDGYEIAAKTGQSLLELIKELGLDSEKLSLRPLAAKIAGEVFTLNYIPLREKEFDPDRPSMRRAMAASGGEVRLLRYGDVSGKEAYIRTSQFVIFLAMRQLWPRAITRMNCTIGTSVYMQVTGAEDFSAEKLKAQVAKIVAEDIPLLRRRTSIEDAIAHFKADGQTDKARLLKWRAFDFFDEYVYEDFADYYYGEMMPSTGYLKVWDIKDAADGFLFVYPDDKDPDTVAAHLDSPNFFAVFAEGEQWGQLMECQTVADLNDLTTSGRIRELIRVNEALHEKRYSKVADMVCERGAKAVMLAGPSSSGKTTSANRLATQLRVHGKKPILMSLDDYYIDRDQIPYGPDGKRDFEHINTIDTELFRADLAKLFQGEEVELPSFNFKTGKREWNGHKPLLPLNLDHHNRIPTSYLRLLRRIVRDFEGRGASVQTTLSMWDSVRRGERRWIFPYQENADVIFNSSTLYELAVLKKHIFPLLTAIEPEDECYDEVQNIVKVLNYVIEADVDDEIPPTSLVREFIGGNTFYRK